MDRITWQKAGALLTILVLSVGSISYTNLFGILFQLKGIEYNYTGDITCGSECESFIDIETSYWRVCFAGYNNTKYENETLFKKVSRSRTLHVNMDNVDNIITTQRLLLNGSYEYYDIEVDWLVPTYGHNWRAIKDGDCWDRKNVNKIKLVGHKNESDTIKWSFGLEDYVDIDPLWKANETINDTIEINVTNVTYVIVDKKILGNPYGLDLSKDNIDSYKNLTTNTCYSETDDMIIIVENCHQNYAKKLIYNVKLINKLDKFSFYTFMVSSGDNIDSSYIDKKLVSYLDKDMIGTTKDIFYELNPFIFKPNETIYFNYTIYPKEVSGKFNFIGYSSYKTLDNAITNKQYIFLDPTWEDAKVSYWNCDTSGSFPDEWGSHTGTIDGATYTASGNISGAYDFDGGNDNILIGVSDDWDGGTDNAFSVGVWVYMDQWDVRQVFIHNFQWLGGGGTSKGFTLDSWDDGTGRVRFRVADVDTTAYYTDISSGWHHLVGTYDGTNQRLYVDADLKDTDAVSLNAGSAHPMSFGSSEDAAGSRGYFFDGKLDEIFFFNKSLNITEITDIYDNGLVPTDTCSCPDSGVDWGWDFDDNCIISANCDIDTGKVYVLNTDAGTWTINAVVTGSKDSTLNGTTGQYIKGNGHLNLTVG